VSCSFGSASLPVYEPPSALTTSSLFLNQSSLTLRKSSSLMILLGFVGFVYE